MKFSISRLISRSSTLIIASCLVSPANAAESLDVAYREALQNIEFNFSTSDDARTSSRSQLRGIQFEAFSRRFDVQLQSNRALLSADRQAQIADNIGIYRGSIAGVADSWARFVIVDGVPRGMFWDGQDVYAIETNANNTSATMFRLQDLQISPGTLSCLDVGMATNGAALLNAVVNEVSAAAAAGPGATQQIDIAIIGDSLFTAAKGANAEADMISRMNIVDGLFSAQVAVQLNVNRIDTFDAANDPFTGELDASLLIDEVADFRFATPAQNANGLTHLFTGRDLDTTTVGIAFGGALCSRRFGAGLTQADHSETVDALIIAHEIGHNFGAPHDGTPGSACEAETGAFLMAPSVNGVDQFSSCSIQQMQQEIASASCVTSLPSTDVAIVAGSQPSSILLGNSTTVEFNANSVGTDTAANVTVNITIPAGVTVNSVTASAGSCTTGAGNASCAIGSIAGGSGESVTLDVEPSAVGNADFAATGAATVNENTNNDQSTIRVTTDPAVDLVVTPTNSAQITLNSAITVRPTVENQSTLAANNVVVTITPSVGLRLDNASWSAGSCAIATNVATCSAATFAARTNSTLNITFTATEEGTVNYSLTASASEVDRDTSNNSVSSQVTVGSPPTPASSDGGGGSFGLWSLLLLLSARVSRLRLFRRSAR